MYGCGCDHGHVEPTLSHTFSCLAPKSIVVVVLIAALSLKLDCVKHEKCKKLKSALPFVKMIFTMQCSTVILRSGRTLSPQLGKNGKLSI